MAFAYEPGAATLMGGPLPEGIVVTEKNAEEMLKAVLHDLLSRKLLDPWCGICKSKQWFYEDRPTRFKTMQEATPALLEAEAANLASAEYLRSRHTRN
jgi:hypothetical protein